MRGGEKVVEDLCRIFPDADIFTLVVNPEKLSPLLRERRITTSFLQRIPGARRHYQKLLPMMPFAVEQFDLQDYDLVISSESGPAKGILPRPDALHLCYCHSPMRYVWDHYHVYRNKLNAVGRLAMSLTAPALRVWDVTTAARVDHFIANSAHVARRISRYYNRPATVVHPPVAVDDFEVAEATEDFYLCAGQLTPYKRVDLAVEACSLTGRRLVVIGEGEEMKRLKTIAGPTVEFLGYQPFPVLKSHLARCRALLFPGEEDFGILPVEAMASGRPVVAYASGGALDTVVDESVGVHFHDQTVNAVIEALDAFEAGADRFEPMFIRAHSERFSRARFRDQITQFVREKWSDAGLSPQALDMAFDPELRSGVIARRM
ncbi:glycosyltransferase [Fulvimarina sp. MAC3]|uniref:glycosyltransferase n=1 Tax=Fulvimarina sp. MAC3 TaxID=3148887 RepID=UPI0031FBBB94